MIFVALVGGAPVLGQLVINEFVADNSGGFQDEDGDASDWVEIYNPSTGPIGLGGWYLTDDPEQLTQWRFPGQTIPAGGYVVVFASGKNRSVAGSALHTNFKLLAEGDYLALVGPDGTTVVDDFAPAYPPQERNLSYGRSGAQLLYFTTPTPGTRNGTGIQGFAGEVKFSHTRGFQEAPFDLTLSTESPGGTIRYTLNGVPPTATTGSVYSGPIPIDHTVAVRAAVFQSGFLPSKVATHTFLFLKDVVLQAPDGRPPQGWPTSWGSNTRDYGMDPAVVNSPLYRDTLQKDLKSLPSFSIVMNLEDLFDRTRGIYANPGQDGRSWERNASVELLNPDGKPGFQINCGIRIRGGFSRSTGNPKHALRLFFREEYGEPKLNYPLFGEEGTDAFDNIDLRTFQNYSWSFQGDSRGVFLRDQFSRDTQLAMGRPSTRGEFYHLYINGMYWGLYNTQERAEASYAESYFGGRKEDYDVIKVEAGSYTINATDGNLAAWTRLYNLAKAGFASPAAYQKVQGNNPDGSRNPDYEVLLDVPNLIDYMLVIIYGGNLDAPISNFLGNSRPNNWYGIRNRTGQEGFRFFAHDSEHTLLNINEDRTGPFSAGDTSITTSNPQYLWKRLQANPEFRLQVADHIQRHFSNGGALTPEAAAERFLGRKGEIDRAVVGESARWGDSKRSTPFTRTDWLAAINGIVNNYFPRRSGIVMNQLRADDFLPVTPAPVLSQHGGIIREGFDLRISAPGARIYVTRDGSDPRQAGGEVSPRAFTPGPSIVLNESTHLRARALQNGEWSPLTDATFTVERTFKELVITEIMYHAADWEQFRGGDLEFIEIRNASASEMDLSGVHFTEGIRYTFPLGTVLGPRSFAVMARNAEAFRARYPNVPLSGVYEGSLSNSGEPVTLVHASGATIESITFGDAAPWPEAADGLGFSLVRTPGDRPSGFNDPSGWRASARIGGSPGNEDLEPSVDPVWITEVFAGAMEPAMNGIELWNPSDHPVDVSHWFLSDDRAVPRKYRIAPGTSIPGGGFLFLNQSAFAQSVGGFAGFELKARGGSVILNSADSSGELTGRSQVVLFGVSEAGVSFGRQVLGDGQVHFVAQTKPTPGAPNPGPRVGPVVINEIQFHPPAGAVEFVELKNLSNAPVNFRPSTAGDVSWRLNGTGYEFPQDSVIPAGGILLVVGGDPDLFRMRWGIPDSVPVLGPFPGVLQDGGELLELQRTVGDANPVPGALAGEYVTVDAVRYDDQPPWPVSAADGGVSLERLKPGAYGNDAANWRGSPGAPSPGLENDGNRSPRVNAGVDLVAEAALFPVALELVGSGEDDGSPGPLRFQWTQINGPAPVVWAAPTAARSSVGFPTSGTYLLRLSATDGELEASDDMTVTIDRESVVATLVKPGSTWRFLDDGSNQGAIWRSTGFNDSSWKSGPAPLGYGDGDEATVLQFGPNASNKQVTSYFRHTFQVANAGDFSGLTLRILRDDGAIVYLNGVEVMRSNMPEGTVLFSSFASSVSSGANETSFFEQAVDAALLRTGNNVLAVEVHQANASSSDISFDLDLSGPRSPSNRAPTVDAGPDLGGEVGRPVLLRGVVLDDGLPNPPGIMALTWTRLSGPMPVLFSDSTAASTEVVFAGAGDYELRLQARDGEFVAEDRVRVTVSDGVLGGWKNAHFSLAEQADPLVSGDRADPDGDGQVNLDEFISGTSPRDAGDHLRIESAGWDRAKSVVQLRFGTRAGRSYQVQILDALDNPEWTTVETFPAGVGGRMLGFDARVPLGSGTRFFRVIALWNP
ncbi:MAG: lamin tail domain-containing protein [Verrucomicrobia bacterium]|nr:lamin tail domain-containing protein [Verrucomicrobiota bacterium]